LIPAGTSGTRTTGTASSCASSRALESPLIAARGIADCGSQPCDGKSAVCNLERRPPTVLALTYPLRGSIDFPIKEHRCYRV
jgi:hypothetical protein